jgi:hypothetical protein
MAEPPPAREPANGQWWAGKLGRTFIRPVARGDRNVQHSQSQGTANMSRITGWGGRPATQADATEAMPRAAWYADPYEVAALRWWDGGAWTEHVHGVPTTDLDAGAPAGGHPRPLGPAARGATASASAAASASASAETSVEATGERESELVRRVMLAIGSTPNPQSPWFAHAPAVGASARASAGASAAD